MSEVLLKVNGQNYIGWTEFNLFRSIENAAAAFSLKVANVKPFLPKINSVCEIFLNSQKALTGYVEKIIPSIDSNSFSIDISGRDRLADIVDSSGLVTNSELINITFEQLAMRLLEPYGVEIKIKDRSKIQTKISKVALNQEPVFEVLEKQARKIGIFVYGDANGSLVIDKIGSRKANTALKLGEGGNILSARPTIDFSERYSDYVIKGQGQSNDNYPKKVSSRIIAKAQDLGSSRKRTLVLLHAGSITQLEAKQKVQWEATVRRARSIELSVKIYGWLQNENGSIWDINEIVDVDLRDAGFYGTMLVKSVEFSLSDSGAFTDLVLVDANAYIPEPVILPKTKEKDSFDLDL